MGLIRWSLRSHQEQIFYKGPNAALKFWPPKPQPSQCRRHPWPSFCYASPHKTGRLGRQGDVPTWCLLMAIQTHSKVEILDRALALSILEFSAQMTTWLLSRAWVSVFAGSILSRTVLACPGLKIEDWLRGSCSQRGGEWGSRRPEFGHVA